jgi:membrane protease YdiL (CAAX protease family)
MTSYDHFIRLLVMAGFMAAGLILTSICSIAILLLGGMSLAEIMALSQGGMEGFTPSTTRALIIAQHILVFILPGLAFGLFYYKSAIWKGLSLSIPPGLILSILGIFLLMAAYPLVNLSLMVNEAIPLPEWAGNFEKQAEDTLQIILSNMNSPLVLLLNLVLIGILPGIGEELIFRGIIQKQFGLILKNPIPAIWISAFIFSAIHFQFEGLLPRMALGVVLGYLYYWTGNLWVPIIAHAFNNGIQVVMIYFTEMDISTMDEAGSEQLEWWMLPISIGIMYILYTSILKNRRLSEQA